jgi:hypothetical protein
LLGKKQLVKIRAVEAKANLASVALRGERFAICGSYPEFPDN